MPSTYNHGLLSWWNTRSEGFDQKAKRTLPATLAARCTSFLHCLLGCQCEHSGGGSQNYFAAKQQNGGLNIFRVFMCVCVLQCSWHVCWFLSCLVLFCSFFQFFFWGWSQKTTTVSLFCNPTKSCRVRVWLGVPAMPRSSRAKKHRASSPSKADMGPWAPQMFSENRP